MRATRLPPRSGASSTISATALSALTLITLALGFSGCVGSALNDQGPPEALHAALDVPDHVGLAPVPTPNRDNPTEILTFDLKPFMEAGLPDVHATIGNVLRLVTDWEDPHEFLFVRSHLVARHRPEEIGHLRAILTWLLSEKIRPIQLDVHVVELDAAAIAEWAPDHPAIPGGGAATTNAPPARSPLSDLAAKAIADGTARSVARRHLRLVNGQWAAAADSRVVRPVTSVTLRGDQPEAMQQTRRDGLTLNAAVWLGALPGTDRDSDVTSAVLHLEAAVQIEVADPSRLPIQFHPKDRESVEVAIDLPTLQTIAIRGQAAIARGQWTVMGTAPSTTSGRSLVALARVSWIPHETVFRYALDAGRELRILPVALPEAHRPAVADGFAWGKSKVAPAQGGVSVFSGFDFTTVTEAYFDCAKSGLRPAPALPPDRLAGGTCVGRFPTLASPPIDSHFLTPGQA